MESSEVDIPPKANCMPTQKLKKTWSSFGLVFLDFVQLNDPFVVLFFYKMDLSVRDHEIYICLSETW